MSKRVALLIGLGAFIVQLLIAHQFGLTWDEPIHAGWGEGMLTARSELAAAGIYGPLYYLVHFLIFLGLNHIGVHQIDALHIPTILMASIGLALLFLLTEALFTRRIALRATVLTALFPILIGHAQGNPKDLPLMVFVLLAMLLLVRGKNLGSGIAFGFALALKYTAILALPALLIRKHDLRTIGWGIIGVLLGYLLNWLPLLGGLFRSLAVFGTTNFWHGKVLYLGTLYDAPQLPWHYSLFHLFLSIPLLTLLLAIIGTLIAIRRKQHAVFLLVWLFVPFIPTLIPGISRFDGIRQFLFALPPVLILAGLGWETLAERMRHRALPAIVINIVIVSWLGSEVVRFHPYEMAYANEVVRILAPKPLDHFIETDYWVSSYREGFSWLSQHAAQNGNICPVLAGQLAPWYFPDLRPDLSITCTDPTYIMIPTRWSQVPENFRNLADTQTPIMTVSRPGMHLLEIYEVHE